MSALLLAAGVGPASAGSNSTNLNVSATVNANCSITTTALNFGSYDPAGVNAAADLDGTGTVTITCTKGSVTNVELDLGSNPSGATRRMTNGTDYLQYEIYQDSGRNTTWGTAGNRLDTGTAPNKSPRDFTAYGRVFSGQDVSTGVYTDTVIATVNF